MKSRKIEDIILSEMAEIKQEIKEIRQNDIPNLKIEMAIEKEKSNRTVKLITGVGGAVAVLVSTAIAYLK